MTVLGAALFVLIGIGLGAFVAYLDMRRWPHDPLTPRDVRLLRIALARWATRYNEARPREGSKYFKRREQELWLACAFVGTDNLDPRTPQAISTKEGK